jgi:hypothetical protein
MEALKKWKKNLTEKLGAHAEDMVELREKKECMSHAILKR